MSEIKDGGPAFPSLEPFEKFDEDHGQYVTTHQPAGGMTLRDYFAAKALPAVTAGDHVNGHGDPERHSALAYAYADAMLKAREPR